MRQIKKVDKCAVAAMPRSGSAAAIQTADCFRRCSIFHMADQATIAVRSSCGQWQPSKSLTASSAARSALWRTRQPSLCAVVAANGTRAALERVPLRDRQH